MMRVLIIIAHVDPTENSTSHQIAKISQESLEFEKNEVKIIDLIKTDFKQVASISDFINPIDDGNRFQYNNQGGIENLIPLIREHQEFVTWATHLIIIGPMWFYRYPAIFYSWFERIFTRGFGYSSKNKLENGLMKGKKVLCIMTTAGPSSMYSVDGFAPIESFLFPITYGFRYCGFTILRSQAFYSAGSKKLTEKDLEWLNNWSKIIKNLDQRPIIEVIKNKQSNEAIFHANLEDIKINEL